MRSFMMCSSHHLLSDKIKEDEMGRVCGTYGGRREMYTGFWRRKLEERDHLEVLGIDERILLKWILKK
jgi:hypothetical protein